MKLMSALDASRVEVIKREFERIKKVRLEDFVTIMEDNLPPHLWEDMSAELSMANQQQKLGMELAANLVELFKEIDINGDGYMEWEEFTRFITGTLFLSLYFPLLDIYASIKTFFVRCSCYVFLTHVT